MARADKGMGGGVAGGNAGPNGHQAPGKPPRDGLSEGDLANEKMGDAGAQGPSDMKGGKDDLLSNTREDYPAAQPEPADGPLEAFDDEVGELGKAPDTGEPRVNKNLS